MFFFFSTRCVTLYSDMSRVKKLVQGLLLVGVVFFGTHQLLANSQGDGILISEVEYDPAHSGVDQSYEWFELFNPTAHDIDISGYQFTDGGAANATLHIDENTSSVTTVTASDPDTGDTIHYAISGGADSALFSIDANTGVLTVTPLDYEHPTDADTDGVYEVEVQASDGFLSDTQHISVAVDDVPEASSSSHVRHHKRSRRISRARLLAIFRRRSEEHPHTVGENKNTSSSEGSGEAKARVLIFVYLRPLSYGDYGEDVKALQHILNILGFSAGEEDGMFGERTREAVKRFQESAEISVDGVFGRESAAALMTGREN